MTSAALLCLLQLADPALPIGGFSHSAGLETYVQFGLVRDKKTAADFVVAQLSKTLFYTDGALLSLSFDAASEGALETLLQLDEECNAVKLPAEMRQASQKLGLRLMKLFGPMCRHPFSDRYQQLVITGVANGHYAIAFGLFAFVLGVPKEQALVAFYYNAAAGMVTNSVKLVPLGQQEGQAILFSLQDFIAGLAARSMVPDRECIGFCCTGFDLRSMQHERLYSRLYMS